MGFETLVRAIRHEPTHGFETSLWDLKLNDDLGAFTDIIQFETSLWDLKQGEIGWEVTARDVFETSLWDLKHQAG